MEREVLIAGAGVAGLTAAINLKRAGRAVRVIERHRALGAQRYPDWDAVENWTSLRDFPLFLDEIGVERQRFRYSGGNEFSVIDSNGKQREVHTSRPLFYLVRRGASDGSLEHGLQVQAQEMGIPIEYDTVCPPGHADIWAGGTFGQASRFILTGFTFETNHPDWVCIIVDMNIAPRAYAYMVIIEGEGTMAVVLTEAKQEANHFLQRARETYEKHADLRIRNVRKSGGIGGDLAAFWHGFDRFVIGEAAGFQDFLWGFGVRHALHSGYLAAEAILTRQDFQKLANAQIRPLVRASMVNRWLYDHVPNGAYARLIRRFAEDPNLEALLSRWYHARPIHRLLWPVVARSYRKAAWAVGNDARYRDRTSEAALLADE